MNREHILALLNSDDSFEKLRALKFVREQSIFNLSDVLVEMLKNEENELVSEAIVDTLKSFDVPKVSKDVSALFEEDRLHLRDLAVVILAHHRGSAVSVLRERLKNEDKHIRKLALDALILMNNPEVIDIISLALDDSDTNNVIAAIETIGNFEAHDYTERVLSILKESKDSFLTVSCLETLVKIGDEDSFKAVNEIFPDPESLPDFFLIPYLKLAIKFPYRDYLQILLKLTDKRGEPFHSEIIALMESYVVANKVLEPFERERLCSAVWKLFLGKIPPVSKYEAIKLLGKIGCKNCEEKLISLLNSENFFEQIGAIEALALLKSKRGIKAIKEMLSRFPSEELKEIAQEAIKKASE